MAFSHDQCEQESLEHAKRPSSPPPFLLKTYMLVDNPATDGIISWNADGTAFVVWQPAEFSRDLLPTLFKHCNFSSFVRQLNTYGFRKVATSRWEFCNGMFRRGERELLSNIRRRREWERKSSLRRSNSIQARNAANEPVVLHEAEDDRGSSLAPSSSEYSNMLDENKRLKRQNDALHSELKNMKTKCKQLHDLVEGLRRSAEVGQDENERPKLFGVRLEVAGEKNRKREAAEIVSEKVHVLLSQSIHS
ncbi:hypothetical protein Sjap_002312 [Stephania japonica]|uniref:HSF-type DNA-binding domain-containing protein n=1 Tax=Stephania japonica TaxID=461633 RepID=A0AAP0KNV9_9MAGN